MPMTLALSLEKQQHLDQVNKTSSMIRIIYSEHAKKLAL